MSDGIYLEESQNQIEICVTLHSSVADGISFLRLITCIPMFPVFFFPFNRSKMQYAEKSTLVGRHIVNENPKKHF